MHNLGNYEQELIEKFNRPDKSNRLDKPDRPITASRNRSIRFVKFIRGTRGLHSRAECSERGGSRFAWY